jgi:hypothetical protein
VTKSTGSTGGFSAYRSVPLGDLQNWLAQEGYDTTNRDRLRPLYGLKLQQEFGAHLLRVGPPVLPPLTYAAEGKIYIISAGEREIVEELTNGEVMLSHHKGVTVVRMTPKIVDAMKRGAEELVRRLTEAKAARSTQKDNTDREQAKLETEGEPRKPKADGEQLKIDAISRDVENDDYWITLVDGVVLNAPGSVLDKGSTCSFVPGVEWSNPGKPRIVLEILEKTAIAA